MFLPRRAVQDDMRARHKPVACPRLCLPQLRPDGAGVRWESMKMTNPRTNLVLVTGISLLSFCRPVMAETAWQDEPIVVTASRTEQSSISVPARISVIDREAIERSQAPDLIELLRLEAGIDISRNGGPGGQTSVFMRGANSNHVLVLIDGVRVSASGTGAFTWEILDPSVIERIEIVRGPRA
ncbi:MAG TPA: TonB-dependent receptor plug domain-containing protein, partial [Sphingomonadaceae bacterium]|nr:TonB-dependent receptor plug domain-containing protein [Sphingomonadaceae bacterium]